MSERILWPKSKFPNGYGQTKYKRENMGAHSVAWIKRYGAVPVGLQVCHSCDVKACVNVDHLFLGTHQQNMDDKVKKNRQAKGREHGIRCLVKHRVFCKGEKCHTAKLKEKDVLEIRQLVSYGYKHTHISELYSISRSVISAISVRKTWKHI